MRDFINDGHSNNTRLNPSLRVNFIFLIRDIDGANFTSTPGLILMPVDAFSLCCMLKLLTLCIKY